MYFPRAVSKEFRDNVKRILSGLDENPVYWKLFGYLAFGTNHNEDFNKLELSYSVLADIAGKPSKSRHFKAKEFLDSFNKDVHPFDYTPWSYRRKRPRLLKNIIWPQELITLIEKETVNYPTTSEKVLLHNGKAFTPNQKRKFREEERKKAKYYKKANLPKEEKALLEYMNNHPKNLFDKTLTNLPGTFNRALDLEKDVHRECNLLKNILIQSQPFYKPTANSTRIFPTGGNILCLKRELRKQLTSGWIEMDLKSAQLAICTKLMNIPLTYAFLKEGNSIWKYLMGKIAIQDNPQNKDILKKTMYSLIFGATRKTLKNNLRGLGQNKYQLFMQNPIIYELLKARNRKFAKIRKNKGETDCFGRWLSCNNNDEKRSVLAQLAQAYELKLLYPAVDYAIQNPRRFRIVLWQHDGFSLVVFDKSRTGSIVSNLKYAVESEASELSIPTEIEVTYN